jgi:pimeloyl-ACP methyl ester carboxylesterase
MARSGWWLLVVALTTTLLGCSYGISVRRAETDAFNDSSASAIADDELSPRTLQTLRRADLAEVYQHNPREAQRRLHQSAIQDPRPDLLFALAEISFLMGRQSEKSDGNAACCDYYFCAGYAFHYLFSDINHSSGSPGESTVEHWNCFDPRFRLACELYNNSLAKCIRAAQRVGRLDPRQQLRLPTADEQGFTLSVVHHGFAWRPEEFQSFQFCSDYQVVGLDNQYRGYGLGVPLIGIRDPSAPAGRGHVFYPDEVSFPVTAFFRFEGGVADLGTQRCGQLELYNPLAIQSVPIDKQTIPLETDLTTPLAYFLSRTDLNGIQYTGFLSVDRAQSRSGIYMFEPYQPGKIPVLMVHGLLSSPLTWTTMFNDLRADPFLREHFQFWFYLYPTGNTYLTTAADLRQNLARLRDELDPERRDPVLDQMVFVAHSMGGLVSQLLTIDSGDDFWRLISAQPFDSIKVRPESRKEFERTFFFDRQPFVRRVVFIATPHHGSKLSPSLPGRLAVQFVHLPNRLMAAAQDLAQENPQNWHWLSDEKLPTSVDLLAPGAPALELLAARPRPEGVHYHSIIGDIYNKGEDGSDSVVTVRSAQLPGVDSEIVVPADHEHVHHHPRAVQEVRRILVEHYRAVMLPQSSAQSGPPPQPPGSAGE